MKTKIIRIDIVGETPLIVHDCRAILWMSQWRITWKNPPRSNYERILQYIRLAQQDNVEVPSYFWGYLEKSKKYHNDKTSMETRGSGEKD